MNIEQLSKQLTHDEFEKGRNLFTMFREQGIPTVKAVAMIYRTGCIEGNRETKGRLNKEITRLHQLINSLKNSLPEANAVVDVPTASNEEGSATNG